MHHSRFRTNATPGASWCLIALTGLAACSDPDTDPALDTVRDAGRHGGDAGARDGGNACRASALEHSHTSDPASHVAEPLDPSDYNSEPPSSGPHCPVWGQYASYGPDAALDACHFVHNLEHGAVVLLYNCPSGCPDLVETLQALHDAPPSDPDCVVPRLIVTPYEHMDATVAAAAWGYTWTADCLDDDATASLRAFISDRWGSRGEAPEPTVCGDGVIGP